MLPVRVLLVVRASASVAGNYQPPSASERDGGADAGVGDEVSARAMNDSSSCDEVYELRERSDNNNAKDPVQNRYGAVRL